jgi:diguanylate cyclase (GGDEF)-like protein
MIETQIANKPTISTLQRATLKRVARVTFGAVVASLLITLLIGLLVNGDLYTQPLGLAIATLAPLIIAPCASYSNISLSLRLREANHQLRALSETDSLTGTLNRRRFVEVAERELHLAQRHCYPTSVVIVDFDNFKRVNDRYGHAVGDRALVHAISLIKDVIRESDVLARFGGEEFILLLPHTAKEGAHSLTERILDRVRSSPMEIDGQPLAITLSAGSVTCETSHTPLDDLMCRADELLYASKQNGRDQCTVLSLAPRGKPTLVSSRMQQRI